MVSKYVPLYQAGQIRIWGIFSKVQETQNFDYGPLRYPRTIYTCCAQSQGTPEIFYHNFKVSRSSKKAPNPYLPSLHYIAYINAFLSSHQNLMIQKFHHGKDSSAQIPIICGLSMCINNLCPTTMTTICPMNTTDNITILDQP